MIINLIYIDENYLKIFGFFVFSFFSLSILYCFISFVEKIFYDAIEEGRKNYALFIVAGITLGIYILYFICSFIARILNKTTDYVSLISLLNTIANQVHLFYLPCFVWLLTFIYSREEKNKCLDLGITLFSSFALIQLVLGLCSYEILMLSAYKVDLDALKLSNLISFFISRFLLICMGCGLTYFVYHVSLKVKDSSWWIIIPILYFANILFSIVSYFFSSLFFILCSGMEIAYVILIVILLVKYIEKKRDEEVI